MLFNFSIPITWTDIINILAAISTMAAVIVAIIANLKTQKQLKASLAIQEQAKNVDLYDKRVAVIDELKNKKPVDVDKLNIVLLFNEDIVNIFDRLSYQFEELLCAIRRRNRFLELLDEKTVDAPNIWEKIQDYQEELDQEEWENIQKVERFKSYCKKQEVFEIVDGERIVYNYYEILTIEMALEESIEEIKASLLVKMGLFISISIAPIKI